MRPYYGLRSYTDNVKCYQCMLMEDNGRDPRQAWPDYAAHVREVHIRYYDGQIGSEATPAEYVAALMGCTREWVRVLKPAGSLFVNLGDRYAGGSDGGPPSSSSTLAGNGHVGGGPKLSSLGRGTRGRRSGAPKSLLGLPWRYALAACDQLGLILRAEIIWAKPNGLPESVTDRVRRAHEQVFHFVQRPRYYSAVDEIREPQAFPDHGQIGKDPRGAKLIGMPDGHHDRPSVRALHPLGKLPGSVWNIPSQPLTVPPALGTDHFAAFPMELPRRIIAGWSPPGVCTACGEGRRPVRDSVKITSRPGYNVRDQRMPGRHASGNQGREGRAGDYDIRITGYACACPRPDAPARPALVVDPFGGTGTTALLASALGRHGITIDRSADYCRLAAWRTTDRGELARALQVPKPPPVPEGQDALFDM